jgi:hypothetical protein
MNPSPQIVFMLSGMNYINKPGCQFCKVCKDGKMVFLGGSAIMAIYKKTEKAKPVKTGDAKPRV